MTSRSKKKYLPLDFVVPSLSAEQQQRAHPLLAPIHQGEGALAPAEGATDVSAAQPTSPRKPHALLPLDGRPVLAKGGGAATSPARTNTFSEYITRPHAFAGESPTSGGALPSPSPTVEHGMDVRALPAIHSYRQYAAPATLQAQYATVKGMPLPPIPTAQATAMGAPAAATTATAVASPTSNVADCFLALEPKVMLPFANTPGQTPRKIQVERKKRAYKAQALEDLLRAAIAAASSGSGDLLHGADAITQVLPLELFDNTEYEERSIPAWLDIAAIHAGGGGVPAPTAVPGRPHLRAATIPLPAKAFHEGKWKHCLVTAYNTQSGLWRVVWSKVPGWELQPKDFVVGKQGPDGKEVKDVWMHRLNVMFLAEDPERFAARVASAYNARYQSILALKMNFYVDCMPTEHAATLDPASLETMVCFASNYRKRFPQVLAAPGVLEGILAEVRQDYVRAHNLILLQPRKGEQGDALFVAPDAEVPVVRQPITMPAYDFTKHQADFAFSSFLTKTEVLRAMAKLRVEYDKLLSCSLFAVSLTKITRLDEFDQVQGQSLGNLKSFLRETWVGAVKTSLKLGFRDVGKGWYNIQESNMEVYKISKMRKFMTGVKFAMQDSMRSLLLRSLEDYLALFSHILKQTILVDSVNSVQVTKGEEFAKRPLFSIEVVYRNGQVQYSYDLAQVDKVLLTLFEKSFGVLQGLPDLEPLVMDRIFWATKPVLQAPHTMEPEIRAIYATLKASIAAFKAPLEQYLAAFQPHLSMLNLDLNVFAQEYELKGLSVEEMGRDIATYQRDWDALDKMIPPHIQVGLFWVGTESVRSAMRKDLSKVVLEVVCRRTTKLAQSIAQAYSSVHSRLRESPTSIEGLHELREYIAQIPALQAAQAVRMQDLAHHHELLERYKYELSNEDVRAKWSALAWPGKVEEQLVATQQNLEVEQGVFLRAQLSDQESFKDRMGGLGNVVADFGKHNDIKRTTEIMQEVNRVTMDLKEAQALASMFNQREKLFGLPVTEYELVGAITKEFEPYKNLWQTASDWKAWRESWLNGPFMELDPESVERNLLASTKTIFRSLKAFKSNPGCQAVTSLIKDEIESFKPYLPLIQSLRNPGMRQRHWDKLNQELGTSIYPGDSLTLDQVLKLNLLDRIDIIQKVCDVAGKEYSIESALDKMDGEWAAITLSILPYKDSGTFIMRASEEMLRLLDDHIVMTQSMLFSPFKKPFAERISQWESKLCTVQEVMDAWMTCQRSWLYLEPIFSSDDITNQLPVEAKRFLTMDRTWRRIMTQARAKPGVIEFCADNKLLDSFNECNKLLEQVSKGLSLYLESKRIAFPRFFFLSDDELLQILSQSKDPQAVQPHLRKCFENISKLNFSPSGEILAMVSGEGEVIPLQLPFRPSGPVEAWLGVVESQMRASVKKSIRDALASYHECPRVDWVLQWPGQSILAGSQVEWTAEVTEALHGGRMAVKELYDTLLLQLQGLIALVRGELPFLSRLVLGDLIVVDVHCRDVVKRLIDNHVASVADFEWISQLRSYWEEEELRIKIVNASFPYGNEYLGNTGRLVITPLTDRCYLTLTGAMYLGMGGAPAGPAGTGKTETVKDLAKSLAKQCVVFNCSDQLDYLAMAKFFKGLAAAGAWACFDEFNRIDIEVLSVIAQQIMTIQKACLAGQTRFMFEGVDLPLDASNAIFITMNPGYAGRTELPDNLKALFRPVAMMIPNYTMIAEISLFSFGFSQAKVLSEKMVATFKLSSEQLSSQNHYDFGMRAVKTVISSAGNLKRQEPDTPEDLILLRSLCDCNLPKFLADDVPLFNGIISDLFPGIVQPKIDYGSLLTGLNEALVAMELQPEPAFIDKCIQLYETTVVRHGLMLVGPTGGGKTSCSRALARAITSLQGTRAPNGSRFERVRMHSLNPKSITMGQLYGEFDAQTHEWTDGILSCLMREGVEDTTPDRKWYVFDGPVDAVWIESMNTLLDDNKKLCLSSGEIIKMSNTQTMMFEVEDLAYASPATVSRCGMIYIEPGALGIQPLFKSWLARQSGFLPSADAFATWRTKITALFDQHVQPALTLLRKSLRETVTSTNGNLVSSLLRIYSCLLQNECDRAAAAAQQQQASSAEAGATTTTDAPTTRPVQEFAEPLFLFSLIWSVGATCDEAGRQAFDVFVRQQLPSTDFPLPREGRVYDYLFDTATGQWIHWMHTIPPFELTGKVATDTIVPTIDTVRNSYLMDLLLTRGHHVLVSGPTGTGKSVTVTSKLLSGMSTLFSPLFMNFSARTSANRTQDFIDSKLEKKRKGVFGPPNGKRMIVFVDDLNMPLLDICGSQPPIELLRQFMDYHGWYDRKNIGKFMELLDLTFVCAMGPPGGGRNVITNRFIRHFNLLSFVEMNAESCTRIFGTILKAFLSKFPTDIQAQALPIVGASLHIYDTIRQELLPTPAKSHYTFNLRDLSKVIQGLLSADVKTISGEPDIIRLWAHECMRVFQDRLVDSTDKSWFSELLKDTMQAKLGLHWGKVVSVEPLLYGDYLVPGADPKVYMEIKDMRKLVKLVEDYLEDYNGGSTSPMKLVMFLDAIEHVSRICRIIRQPGGHALLLGVGGSGRQSLSRLATFMEEFDIFQIEISKSYGQNEWREDLKKVLFEAGLNGKSTVFLYCDTQIISEGALEDVNNILNGGDVPNIYTSEELERIMIGMRPLATDQGITPTKENLFALYISRVRRHLHLIICMSPIGDAFRNRLRMFPCLVNCCTIDWFSTWPREALRSVAASSIAEINDLGSETIIDGIVSHCVYMHESVRERCSLYRSQLNRHNYVTPKSYLELLALYKTLLDRKRNELLGLRKRTSLGLEKLLAATKEVENLQEELEAMQPMLLQTSLETEHTMLKIAEDKLQAEEIKAIVEKEEAASSKKAEETKAIADDAKRDLDEALPALEAAVESLNSLSKNDIIEVRSMQRPPEGVKLVIEAICIMKMIKPKKIDGDKPGKKVDDYWEPGRALLADPGKFLESLMTFDKENISEATIQKIKPYIDSPEFQVSVISRVSKAATSMCQWVRAMEKYYWVSRSVAPKRARLQEAQESLDQTMRTLAELKKTLRDSEISIREMEKQFAESVSKKEELSRKVEECNVKLSRAGKLISGLGGERQRWALAVDAFDVKLGNIVGDVLLASGCIAYLGAFTAEFRAGLLNDWVGSILEHKIPHSENSGLWESLGDQVKLREWEIHGLPKDNLSRDNAVIVNHSRRWPLLIDPQGQANKWIKSMEKDNGLDVVKLTDRDFLRTLENAIRFGKPVLLENVGEKLDPALEPILLKLTFKQQGTNVIKIGDSIIPYHDDFRFYLTTKLPNPHYSPEISATVTILNFTLAPPGLEDQLLAIVVANERPDLEEAKNELTVNNALMQKELKDIEDKILYLLSSVQGSPVDDERLIDTLAASKDTSDEIQRKFAIAQKTERDIDFTRNKYVPVAIRTRILFFCITELASIDPMYQYSLGWFMNLFVSSLTNSEPAQDIERRTVNICDYFTFSLFNNVCRSLFEKHKLLFSFLMLVRILMNENAIDLDEWRFLLTGETLRAAGTGAEALPNPAPEWMSGQMWMELSALTSLPAFSGFADEFATHHEDYKVVFDSPQPHRVKVAGGWAERWTPFQHLLFLRCLRIDKMTLAVQDYVATCLGQKFIEPGTSDLGALYKESSSCIPLIFVLSPGADPANALYKFAEEMRFGKKLVSISLGQGQGPKAEALIKESTERGLWVLLQNCHLAPSWMPALDRIIDSFTPDKVHRDFRLWLTSMPTPRFPVTILQNGVKTTIEPPNGIRANLMRNYASFAEDMLSTCAKPREWRKLLFALCTFHAVIQERRKFGALGWNIPYEFTDGDLRICHRQLKIFLEEYEEIPFKVLRYTVGEINYGGRVTDDFDRRLIMNILADYYTPEVLEDGYLFSASPVYQSIPAEGISAYRAYIKGLPMEESTDIFSMHDNANITFAQKESYGLFEQLLSLMPKSGGGSSGSTGVTRTREEQLLETCLAIQAKIPKEFSAEQVLTKYPIQYKESMSTVLNQEVIRYNKLLCVIHTSLVEVIKALKGLVVMSEQLENMCNSIFVNQVPAHWAASAYPSLKSLSGWVSDLVLRCDFIQKWIDQGIPVVFWISGFFFPQAFLTGTLQNYARKNVLSIDTLSFDFTVLDTKWQEIRVKPTDGVYIRGMYMEGARWDGDKKRLGESRPKELYTEMSVIWLCPVQGRKVPDSGIYRCPVYKTLTRAGTLSTTGHSTNYILTIELPSGHPESHWIKRGVALVTGLAIGF